MAAETAHMPAVTQPEEPEQAAVPLFRPQVLAAQQTQWMGTVLVAPRPSHYLYAVFSCAALIAVLSLLFLATYAKKVQLSGWLVPEQGVIKVFAQEAGVAEEFYVKEGDVVEKGQPLLVLSTERKTLHLGDTQANIAKTLVERRDSLLNEQQELQQLLRQQTAVLSNRLAALRMEQQQIDEEIALQEARLNLARKNEERQRELQERGFISEQQVQAAAEARLEQAARFRGLQRIRINLQREQLTLHGELRDLPIKVSAQSAQLARGISALEQQMTEVESRREIVIPAPQAGIVTAVQSSAGGHVPASVPLLTIVPADSMLEAHLYAPSRAVGFLQSGQRVRLRYQAYPYQKFGHHEGVVTSVSRSAITPAELPPQMAGVANLSGSSEPVYRITVALESQTVTAYGNAVALQPGMRLEAAVVVEERRLYEWILDPLYTLTGKLGA